jgi:flavin reductase (DIM6/NTAB) family NADH-FMN oxidoreductase RutF
LKIQKNPQVSLYPCPVVLVTCVDERGLPNIITLAWVGAACSEPPMLSMGIRPGRYSYDLISKTKEFVVNIPTERILEKTDFCGISSGLEADKFSETGLTPMKSSRVKPPLIKECPVNMECVLRQIAKLGSHHLFLGEIVAVHVDSEILDEKGRIDYAKALPISYLSEEYWSLGKKLGIYGLSKHKN